MNVEGWPSTIIEKRSAGTIGSRGHGAGPLQCHVGSQMYFSLLQKDTEGIELLDATMAGEGSQAKACMFLVEKDLSHRKNQ